VKEVDFDFVKTGFALVITDVGGGHDDAASQAEYASLPTEMKAVAAVLGAKVLREVTLEQIVDKIPEIRKVTGDRAILRAYHFQGDNQRVVEQVAALENNDFQSFLKMVVESGYIKRNDFERKRRLARSWRRFWRNHSGICATGFAG